MSQIDKQTLQDSLSPTQNTGSLLSRKSDNNSDNSSENLALPEFSSTVDNSLCWRLWHGINYIIGGLTFLIGSIVYFPSIYPQVDGFVLGGWLFTLGSFTFLLSDCTEWNHFRYGCIGDTNTKNENMNTSVYAKYKRAEMGVNFFISVSGSTLYLIGSIFFIPATNMLSAGENIFIIGSAVIVVAQVWKLYRTGITSEINPQDHQFRWANLAADLPGFWIDYFAGVGGFFYLVGTYLFALSDSNAQFYVPAVSLFTCGGTCFFLSGVCMQYRYHCTKQKDQFQSFKDEENQ